MTAEEDPKDLTPEEVVDVLVARAERARRDNPCWTDEGESEIAEIASAVLKFAATIQNIAPQLYNKGWNDAIDTVIKGFEEENKMKEERRKKAPSPSTDS